MSSLKTKFKQVLTTLLALAMLFAMAPILPDSMTYADEITYTNSTEDHKETDDVANFPNTYGPVISSNKAKYAAGENIYIKIENASSATSGGWIGIYDTATANNETTTMCWAYTGSSTVVDVTDYIIYGPNKNAGVTVNSELGYGTYYIILMADDGRWAVLPIEIESDATITLNKEGSIPQYNYGEQVLVTAQCSDETAWVGVYDINPDFPDGYYARFDVKDVTGSVDLIQLAADAGKPLGYGKQYRVYISVNNNGNPNYWVKQVKFELIDYYTGPTWSWDNAFNATATFAGKNSEDTKEVAATVTSEVTKEATEEEEGERTYTATVTADMIDFATENDPPFIDTKTEVIPKLTHVHTCEAVAAKDPTCEDAGNIAYYECSGCHKYFEDADATIEIEDKTSVVRPASGHAYGNWTYNETDKTHSRVCANNPEHVDTANCTFVDGDVVDGKRTHTCSVCGGSYTTDVNPVITTDHESYLYGSDILVTSNLNETPNSGWMAVYYKDQYKDADKYGQSLIWWYVGDGETTKNIKEITKSVNDQGIGQDYDGTGLRAGDYEAVYLDNGYVRHGEPTYFSVYYEYNAPGENDWTWAEDGSSATATFKADGVNFDEIETPTDPEIKTLTDNNTQAGENTATCTQGGTQVYTASVTVPEDAFVLKGNPESRTFTSTYTKNTTALGHSWGAWTEVTPATETEQGLETHECSRCHDTESRPIPVLSHTHQMTEHPAVAATCVAAGNTAYWVCDKGDNPCGKYFSDEEGENEIEKDSWIIPVTNEHDYGDWTFDGKDKKTHTKTCSRDASHKVTEDCTFEDTKEGDVIKHTCTVCGGSYTTSSAVLSVDKEKYDVSDPIMVTTNFSGTKAWVGLYKKGESYNPDAGGVKSIFWYYLDEQTNPVDIKKTRDENGRSGDFGPGKYKVVLFNNDSYTPEAECEFTVGSETASSIEIDETEYTMGDPIMVTATSDYSGAWVGLYDYDNSDPLDTTLLSYYMLSDSNGEPVDIWNGDIVKDKEKLAGLPAGKYKVILFTSGYDIDNDSQGRMAIRSFDLKDNTGCDHEWGEWTFNEEDRTHTHVCKKDPSHKETKPCIFDDGVETSDPGVLLYTCKICGGTYEGTAKATEPVIKTDKEKYEVGEDILVTTELNGYDGTTDGGWIALYQRGSQYRTSLLWYYPACFENPKVLQSVLNPSDTNLENLGEWPEAWGDTLAPGAYELVYLSGKNQPYDPAGNPSYFFVGVKEDKTDDPTCTEPGNRHLLYEDGTESDIEIPALGHDPSEEWTYIPEEKAHYHACSRCDEQLEKAACTFNEGEVTKEPTAKEEGEMTYTCTVCGGTYTEAIPTLEDSGVKRIYGSTRYQTAILQANELKAVLKVDKFDAVIVATGENFADALSGAYLGYVKKAPMLLVNNSSVNEVKDYIQKNLASGGTIYLLGGPTVVPNNVTAGLSGFTPKRLYGKTRYETNIEILKEAGVKGEELMICDGNNFADSLSASAAKRPILLVDKSLNKAQLDYLDTLRTKKCYLVGGTGVLPTALENVVKSKFAVKRLGGKDRFDTSVKVAEELFSDPSKAVLAYGMNYPDGLCGGTLAAYMGGPLLLVHDDKAATTKAYTSARNVASGIVLGGPTLISDGAARSIYGLNSTDQIYEVTE